MQGKDRRVLYSCPFVPAEWIEAHGLQACRPTPSSARPDAIIPAMRGVCPFARAFANMAVVDTTAAAIVTTTVCDQMQRMHDMLESRTSVPLFQMAIPEDVDNEEARAAYVGELGRFSAFLVSIGGRPLRDDDLAKAMLHRQQSIDGYTSPEQHDGVPLAVVGGPILSDHTDFFRMVEQAGGKIALDGTETGERVQPAEFDREKVERDPAGALVDAYFGTIPDPFRKPAGGYYRWLRRQVESRGIKGIVVRRYVWCEIWHAEAKRMYTRFGTPFLDIDVGEGGADRECTYTRVRAFVESLR